MYFLDCARTRIEMGEGDYFFFSEICWEKKMEEINGNYREKIESLTIWSDTCHNSGVNPKCKEVIHFEIIFG